jgi:hypothetical protein
VPGGFGNKASFSNTCIHAVRNAYTCGD